MKAESIGKVVYDIGARFQYEKRGACLETMKKAHLHQDHELYYLEKGSVQYFVDNKLLRMEPGDLIFIPAGSLHQTSYANKAEAVRRLLLFREDILQGEARQRLGVMNREHLVRFSPLHKQKIYKLLTQIEEEQVGGESDFGQMQELYFQQLILLAFRYRMKIVPPEWTESQLLIQEVAAFISENFGQPLFLQDLARKFGFSPCYLSRMFKDITGVGICEYIQLSRITAAEKLLQGGMPVSQVAAACGFNDSNYFGAVFKKVKGITPKKYAMREKGES